MEEVPQHIRKGLPPELVFKESSMASKRTGVWAKKTIKKGKTFGPFEGTKKRLQDVVDDTYSWEIRGPKGRRLFCIDATDPNTGNWMRYVKSARYYEEQNIIASQEKRLIFYKAMRDIPSGEELLCWFSSGYLSTSSPNEEDSSNEKPTNEPQPDPDPEPTPEAEPDPEPEPNNTSTSPGSEPLAIALGTFQITNVVSLASPEKAADRTTDHPSECKTSMPILEKIHVDVIENDAGSSTASVVDSQQATGRSASISPPLISPVFINSLANTELTTGKSRDSDSVQDITDDKQDTNDGIDVSSEDVSLVGNKVTNIELQTEPLVSKESSETAHSIGNDDGSHGDVSHDENTEERQPENGKSEDVPPSTSTKASKGFPGKRKGTLCMLKDPTRMVKKLDYLATTRYKKNILRCLTCSQVFMNISALRGHFGNSSGLSARRRRRIKRSIKRIISRNASQSCSTGNESIKNGSERVEETYNEFVEDSGPLVIDEGTNNPEDKSTNRQSTPTHDVLLQCDFCDLSCINFYLLEKHVEAHHKGILPYKCRICKTETNKLDVIHSHKISHTIERRSKAKPAINLHGTAQNTGTNTVELQRDINPTIDTHQSNKRPQANVVSKVSLKRQARMSGKKRHIIKIYPCNVCNKMFASKPNVNRHKRVIHGIICTRPRRRRSTKMMTASEGIKLNATTQSQTDDSPSLQYSSSDGVVGGLAVNNNPPNIPIANVLSPDMYRLGGKRVRPILPAPATSAHADHPVSPTAKGASLSPSGVVDESKGIKFSQHIWPQAQISSSGIVVLSSTCQPPFTPTSSQLAVPPVKHELDQKAQSIPSPSRQNFPINNRRNAVARTNDVQLIDQQLKDPRCSTSSGQTMTVNYKLMKQKQLPLTSPPYANTPDSKRQQWSQIHRKSASPMRSPNEGTLASHSQKLFPSGDNLGTYSADPPSNDQIFASSNGPRPYIPRKPVNTSVPSSSASTEHYDEFGAMNLATNKRTIAEISASESALDLSFSKRPRTDVVDSHTLPFSEQTVPLDLSAKPTAPKASYGDTNRLSSQLIQTLEAVNAHAALQVSAGGDAAKKMQMTANELLVKGGMRTGAASRDRVTNPDPTGTKAFSRVNHSPAPYKPRRPQQLSSVQQESIHPLIIDIHDDDDDDKAGISDGQEAHITTMSVDSFLQRTITREVETVPAGNAMDFACNVCGVAFDSMKFMVTHAVEHAKDWPYKCEFCVLLFQNPQDLAEHRTKLHHVKKMYACNICRRDFVYMSNLQKHQTDFHGMKQYDYKELDPGELRLHNFTDPTKAVPQSYAGTNAEVSQPSRVSFIAQEMSKMSPLKIGKKTIPLKVASPGVSPDRGKLTPRKHVPFNPQRHHPFAHARQIGYLSMLADPKNKEQLSTTLVNRCTKCEKEFQCVADFHKHIMECAANQETQATVQNTVEGSQVRSSPGSSVGMASTALQQPCKEVATTSSKSTPESSQPVSTGTSDSSTNDSTEKRKRAKPGLKIYNPNKYCRREPAANVDDIHTCHGCGKRITFISRLERHMRMCPHRDKLKLADFAQVKMMTKKTIHRPINYKHQCPFCKHHYTYLKSLKKHALVCQFRPADIVDPLKCIEDFALKLKEESEKESSIGEAGKSINEETAERRSDFKAGTSPDDNKQDGDKLPKTHGAPPGHKAQETSGNLKAATDSESTIEKEDGGGQQKSILSYFSLKLQPIRASLPVVRKGKKSVGDETTRDLGPNIKENGDIREGSTDNEQQGPNTVPVRKYPVRERHPTVTISFGELSHFARGRGRGRGRGRSRGRGRGRGRGRWRGALSARLGKVGSPEQKRRRGVGRARGCGRGRGRGKGLTEVIKDEAGSLISRGDPLGMGEKAADSPEITTQMSERDGERGAVRRESGRGRGVARIRGSRPGRVKRIGRGRGFGGRGRLGGSTGFRAVGENSSGTGIKPAWEREEPLPTRQDGESKTDADLSELHQQVVESASPIEPLPQTQPISEAQQTVGPVSHQTEVRKTDPCEISSEPTTLADYHQVSVGNAVESCENTKHSENEIQNEVSASPKIIVVVTSKPRVTVTGCGAYSEGIVCDDQIKVDQTM